MQNDPRKQRLELLFIAFVGILMLAAFVSALGYDMVSARAPLCIIVPLLLLVGVQFNRSRKAVRASALREDLRPIVRGEDQGFNTILALIGWMSLFLVLIYGGGHYVGMVVFLFLLLRFVAKESLALSVGVTLSLTAAIYALFEHLFRIELYRGLLYDRVISLVIQ